MACVLRLDGVDLDVDALLQNTTLVPCKVWRKGEPSRRGRESSPRSTSGLNIAIGKAAVSDSVGQIRDAIAFLQQHDVQIRQLTKFPGVAGLEIDFAFALTAETYIQTDHLPRELVELAGRLGIGITLTHYPVSET
jgi:hypothetical protein